MTPNNIVNMAKLKGLSCIALTDHNTALELPRHRLGSPQAGLGFLPGMELSTAEDIHLVCLFPDCDTAEAFSRQVEKALPPVKNNPRIYGHQLCLDEPDRPVGEAEPLLRMPPRSPSPRPRPWCGGRRRSPSGNTSTKLPTASWPFWAIPPECEDLFDAVDVLPPL